MLKTKSMENVFEIKILKLHWIKEDNPDDKEGILNLHEAIICAVDMIDKLIKE